MGAFIASSTSVFVSCKDYDDDISDLKAQINSLDGTVKAQISKLESAQTALESAYKSGDDAMLAAAKQAVADAKKELEAALATKDQFNSLEAAVIKAQTQVEQALKLIDEKASKADVTAMQGSIEAAQASLESIKADLSSATTDLTSVQTDLSAAVSRITTMENDVKTALKELTELTTALSGQQAALETVTDGATAIKSNIVSLQERANELEEQMKVLAGLISVGGGTVDISEVTVELSRLRQTVLDLSDQIDPNINTIVVALVSDLRSLVFVPQLYLDGIEGIEYPWIGGQFLYAKSIKSDWKDLDHHGTASMDLQDIQDPLYDFLPNTLARYYDDVAKAMVTTGGNTYAKKQYALTTANEWIYGPAWAVQYHMNPASADDSYANNRPQFNVLEPDVIYYNTRATASSLGVTSPENFWLAKTPTRSTYGIWGELKPYSFAANDGIWSQRSGSFTPKVGVLTAGIQIAHPNKLAPWPTDDTINPNGYPAATTAPANEAYGTWGWYGLSKYEYSANNYDNTVALQLTNSQGNIITSDYALLIPTRVQLEGLIWYNKPEYIEPNWPGYNIGPGSQTGDEEGTIKVSNYDCTANRIHVWDSPEEALNDERGAALELWVGDQVDLTRYLGVHFIKENLKLKEKSVGVNNDFADVYEVGTWKYGEEAAFGLHYEFQFVDYYNSTNQTRDSRYAAFNDWDGTWASWQATNQIGEGYYINDKCNKTGIIKVKSVNADGQTQDIESTTSVDREPLVRVMLKNEAGKTLLDGYILLHINYSPDNKEIEYPAQAKTFDLCTGLELSSNWSQFSNIVLQTALTNEQILAFDDYYWADCKTGGPLNPDDVEYVTPDAKQVVSAADGHAQYQLKIYNFGDKFGQNISAAAQAAMKNGGASAYEETSLRDGSTVIQSNQGLGVAYYKPNGEGTTNHVFHWYLSPEEIEYITHDLADNQYPVTVSRWFRYVAKDEKRGREVNNYSAPYPYLWVKMTMTIARKDNKVVYKVKDTNYWYHWNTGANNEGMTATTAVNWSALAWDIQAPRNGYHISTFVRNVENSVVSNQWNVGGKVYKHYFAPKAEKLEFYTYTRKADANTMISEAINAAPYVQDATSRLDMTKTVKSVVDVTGMPQALLDKLVAMSVIKKETRWITPQPSGTFNADGDWDLMYCKYVYPHNYANKTADFDPANVSFTAAQNKHKWIEKDLETIMKKCAIDYTRGVFTNTDLYSYNPSANKYIKIATMNPSNGEIELLKANDVSFEEAKLVLNAYGYEKNHENIYKELRAWVGLVANNGCDVAMYTYPEKTNADADGNDLNTFLISWQRPINTTANLIEPVLDANTNENYIHLIDYLKLYDWRGDYPNQGYMYYDPNVSRLDNHYWFWSYYMLKSISLDLNPLNVYTTLHNGAVDAQDYSNLTSLNRISTEVDLYAWSDAFAGNKNAGLTIYNFNENTPRGIYDFNSSDNEIDIEDFMGNPNFDTPTTKYNAQKQRFGTIYYQNNGHNVVKLLVVVPYTIEYEWGWITRFAPFDIDSTHGQ